MATERTSDSTCTTVSQNRLRGRLGDCKLLRVRLYLDACSLNRPFDDQSQIRVRLESEAVLAILERVEEGGWALLSSDPLEFELLQIPDPQRRARALRLLSVAREQLSISPHESTRAAKLRQTHGVHALDALHIACAESMGADAFLTTDDHLIRAARRTDSPGLSLTVANPLTWLTEVLARE